MHGKVKDFDLSVLSLPLQLVPDHEDSKDRRNLSSCLETSCFDSLIARLPEPWKRLDLLDSHQSFLQLDVWPKRQSKY